MYRLPLLSLALSCLVYTCSYAEFNVTARFNPARLIQGDRAQYIVEIQETDRKQRPTTESINSFPIPQPEGLELSGGRVGSSGQETRIINGSVQYSVAQQVIIDIAASRTGKYTIPSFSFEYKGQKLQAPTAHLQVVERTTQDGPPTDELVFLKTDVPETLYVGQTIQVALKMYASQSVRLNGLHSFDREANGFTISELPDSRESSDIYNGRRYRVLTWPLTITPIQTGEQNLNFQFGLSVRMPGQNNTRQSPFGRGMFDDIFGRSERINVYSDPAPITVLPLPEANKPESFSGAIGNFSINVYTDLEATVEGEPIMLSVEVSGQGNFDRISGPPIPENSDWRNYEPQAVFEPRTGDATRGSKRFDYVMIPQNSGSLEIPELRFSYFDPETADYVELVAPAIPIEVEASITPRAGPTSNSHSSSQAQKTVAAPIQQELSLEEALLTLDYQPEPSSRGSSRLWTERSFWIAQAIAALVFSGIVRSLRHQRRLRNDPAFAARQAAKIDALNAAKAARSAQDATEFYQHAQTAIRCAASHRSGHNLRTANTEQLAATFATLQLPQSQTEDMQQLFQQADATRFSNSTNNEHLDTARAQMERILKAL